MADFEKDKQRLKEINAELEKRTRRTKVYIALEEEAVEIKKRQLATQQKLNKEFQLGAKAQRQSAVFSEKVKKLEQEKEKSFSNFLQNLAKGNVLQAVGLDKTRKARQKEIDLAKNKIGAVIQKEWNIKVVPTIIILKKGKEVERYEPGISMRFDEQEVFNLVNENKF